MPEQLVARQIMTKNLTTVRAETDVFEAIDRLLEHRISGAPVVAADGKLVGVLSELDCIRRLVEAAHDNTPTGSVAAFMTREPKTVGPDTDLLTIAHLFMSNPFRRLPVVDGDGVLLGQISRRDLLRVFHDLGRPDARTDRAKSSLSALLGSADKPTST